MTEEDKIQEKIEQQNQTIEKYFNLLADVESGEQVTMKALSVYQLQGSGFVQVNNGKVKAVMRSNDQMVVDKYTLVNEDIENVEEETMIELEDRTIVGIDQQSAAKMGNIINQAMQTRNMEKKKQNQNLGFDDKDDLGYIG